MLSPESISHDMLSDDRVSLNVISEEAAFALISRFLAKGHRVRNVFVDTVGPPAVYKRKFEERFKGLGIAFTVESKADSLFKVVSAASIVAKVGRDLALSSWAFREGRAVSANYGSGYPGDPKTVSWLKEHCDEVFQVPSVVRFSWKTCETLVKGRSVPVEAFSDKAEVSHELLRRLGLNPPKSFVATVEKSSLYRNSDDMLLVSGAVDW